MKFGLSTLAGVGLLAFCVSALAQQTTGVPGSPGATTTITGKQIPPPDPKFGGVIKEKASDSKAWWPPRVVPPKGAPNVLLIMTDDQGFGAPSTFGGVIPTPTMDRIARDGMRYTNFHSTSLCSPTRAAIITGRNHHSVGNGVVGEISTGFPGYNSIIPIEKGTIGTILKANGYATSWFGKDHNTPSFQSSQAGPFDQWPNGMGFDYFYGFVGGDASQWQPNLFRNTTAIYPFLGNPGWNLETAMADEAIQYVKQLKEIAPDKPFFIYYVPGATHAPHHPTPEWIEKISAMHLFDDGWNKLRETIFANQKRLGIMPENAKLTPWPKELPQWDSLSFEEKKLFIKQADIYGASSVPTPIIEIGRVIQAVEDLGATRINTVDHLTSGVDEPILVRQLPRRTPTAPTPTHDAILRDARQRLHLSRRVGGGHDAGAFPWELSTKPPPDVITGFSWELYNVKEDPTPVSMIWPPGWPDKLSRCRTSSTRGEEVQRAAASTTRRLARCEYPSVRAATAGRNVFTYSGELIRRAMASAAPSIAKQVLHHSRAEVEIPEGGAEGMIVTEGGRFGGYGLFLSKAPLGGPLGVGRGKVVFLYNLLDLKRTTWEGPELDAGKHTIVFDFKSDNPGLGKGGTGVLSVDGKEVARNSMEHTTPITFPEDETFDIGQDTRTGVALVEYRYDAPFKFTGKINKLTFKLEPEQAKR